MCTDLTEVTGTNLEIEGSYFGTAYRGLNEPPAEPSKDISVTVDVTLEEMYNGSRKTVSYKKQVLGLDGRTVKQQDASVDIFIKPGMQISNKMTLRGEGNQQAKRDPTNLNICFKQVASVKGSNGSKFERKNGAGLLYRHTLTLNDALQCRPVKMTTMDGRNLLIAIDHIPSPGSVKLIEGEGMPSGNSKGDMYIFFDVKFPKVRLGINERQELVAALAPRKVEIA